MSHIQLSYQIDLTKEQLWDCLFNRLNEWWSKDFYTNPKTKQFVIETKLNGKMYEDFGEGEGLIWGDVIGVDRPNSLLVRGMLSGEFGGPTISFEKFSLAENDGQTTLTYTVEFIGDIQEKTISSLTTGWEQIFGNYLIPFCKTYSKS